MTTPAPKANVYTVEAQGSEWVIVWHGNCRLIHDTCKTQAEADQMADDLNAVMDEKLETAGFVPERRKKATACMSADITEPDRRLQNALDCASNYAEQVQKLTRDNIQLCTRIARLERIEEAAQPFVKCYNAIKDDLGDDEEQALYEIFTRLTLEDFAALAAAPEPTKSTQEQVDDLGAQLASNHVRLTGSKP
jgi:hypothetical protein